MATKCYHNLGFDETNLIIQVFTTSAHLTWVWITIIWRSAFHHIGDVYLLSAEVNGCQKLLQELARWAYKGASLLIFIETRALAYEHQISVLRAFTGNGVCPTFSKATIVAATYLVSYVFKFGHRLHIAAQFWKSLRKNLVYG